MTNQSLATKATTSTQANDLVFVSEDHNRVLTSSEVIAQALDKRHQDVIELIRRYESDFSEDNQSINPITFETWKGEPLPQGGFAKSKTIALLTEEQATLLITYMRNTEKVRKFKIALVKAFFEMRQALSQYSQTYSPDEIALIKDKAFKQGYAIALKNSADPKDKQPKADDRLTITEDEATAIDHMIYFHDMFKPDVLQVFRKVTKLQSQLAALVCTIQDLPLARLYESATAPEVSCQRLKRFNTTKVKKGALVVSA